MSESRLADRIRNGSARVTVIGQGYVGLPLAVEFARAGFNTTGLDTDLDRVTAACSQMAALLYSQIIKRVLEVSSPKVAELAKLYENTFRNVNIALANEFSLMGRRLGVNIREVIEAAATKPFGFMPFYPGPGVGGHCIGIDPFYLAWKMRLNGYEFRFLHLADEVNRAIAAYVVELVAEALNGRRRCLNGASVLVLGVAYKRGVSDIRESPALEVIAELQHKGALVSYADPHVPSLDVEGHT